MSEIYIRRTSVTKPGSVITSHEVWDADRFVASQQEEQRKLRDAGKEHCVITLASRAEYRVANWAGK